MRCKSQSKSLPLSLIFRQFRPSVRIQSTNVVGYPSLIATAPASLDVNASSPPTKCHGGSELGRWRTGQAEGHLPRKSTSAERDLISAARSRFMKRALYVS